jgi:CheY-like chemotaxis protein
VARILHVDDEESWRRIVKESLADHHVESARSLNEAVRILGSAAPFDVALVDLVLTGAGDVDGGELLDLLRSRYPSTGRVVITGNPPGGGLRRTIFERFDVEEVIIKGQLDVPDLRRVVEEAVSRNRDELSQELRLSRSALRQRFRDWRRNLGARIRNDLNIANEHLDDARRVSSQSRRRAEIAVEEAKRMEAAFRARCSELAESMNSIQSVDELNIALEALDAAEEEFA